MEEGESEDRRRESERESEENAEPQNKTKQKLQDCSCVMDIGLCFSFVYLRSEEHTSELQSR